MEYDNDKNCNSKNLSYYYGTLINLFLASFLLKPFFSVYVFLCVGIFFQEQTSFGKETRRKRIPGHARSEQLIKSRKRRDADFEYSTSRYRVKRRRYMYV